MSGHSKFSKIKHKKGAADQKRGALFSKITRNLTVAAREEGDPTANFKLRLVMDRARAAGMTKETVERAIAKGTGADKEGLTLIEDSYEGFGPGKVAYIIEVITDNKNRAYQSLRKTFTDHGGNLGNSGSVNWMFERRGVIRLAAEELKDRDREELELKLIDAGAEDIESEEEGVTVYTKPEELKLVEEKIRAMEITPADAGLEWVAKERITPDEDVKKKIEAFEETLDELEDVNDYYSNT